jgi:hypothetical protein
VLDLPTLGAWNLILRVFFAEYLGLRPDLLRRGEPSSPTYPSAPVRKSDSELVRLSLFFFFRSKKFRLTCFLMLTLQ